MKRYLALLLLLALSACVSIKKVEQGENRVGERMSVNLVGPWNHLDFPAIRPAQLWTMEGRSVDEFLIYSGIRDGQAMHPEMGGGKENIRFRSAMQTEDLLPMFEAVLSREGATFKLLKLEPYRLGGRPGIRFEYERIRKQDNVIQRGLGFAAVDRGELFALVYHAPRLTFFPRHQATVEGIARDAQIY
ncbi:MAG: hypothetical protein RIR00_2595 [Pseudomonadota bacterium]|jgi:hypothetical protein